MGHIISTLEYSGISKYGKGVKIYKYLTILILVFPSFLGRERGRERERGRASLEIGLQRVL